MRCIDIFTLLAGLALLACTGDSPIQSTRCTTDRDCAGGVCQAGRCETAGPGADTGGADQGGEDTAEDPDLTDVESGDPLDDPALDDVPADPLADVPDAPDSPNTNACGGTAVLEGQPGDHCGVCEDGALACQGLDAVVCRNGSSLNLCGGCGPLPGLPGAACGECEGGEWVCDGTDLVCNCDLPDADGTCANPYPLPLGEPVGLSLCEQGDDEDPIAGENDCRDVTVRGQDVVYRLVLANAIGVRLDLRDDDPERAVDTVLYVRTDCEDDQTQVICDDDVPCDESDIATGCVDNIQVRQSTLQTRLEAGTYYVIADSFAYSQGGAAFGCGTIRLEATALE